WSSDVCSSDLILYPGVVGFFDRQGMHVAIHHATPPAAVGGGHQSATGVLFGTPPVGNVLSHVEYPVNVSVVIVGCVNHFRPHRADHQDAEIEIPVGEVIG